MWFSTRNYEKLLLPALAFSIGFHLLAAFVPEGVVDFVTSYRELPSPAPRFLVVPLARESVPVYVEKTLEETPEFAGQILAPAPPEPRLSALRGDSLAQVEIFALESLSAMDSGIDSPTSFDSETVNADSLAEITLYIAAIYERISQARYYPEVSRRLGQEGEVEVSFAISRGGGLDGGTLLVTPSPYGPLNRAAQKSVERSAPFPPLPDCIRINHLLLKVRIVFQLND